MTNTVKLIIAGGESTIPVEELSIERIIAEAQSVGYQEFSVFCNDQEVKSPDDFRIIPGATYIIASPDDALNPDDIIIEEEHGT